MERDSQIITENMFKPDSRLAKEAKKSCLIKSKLDLIFLLETSLLF